MKNLQNNDPYRYDDIIYRSHHQSSTHPHMSMHDRAAQFSPFAALTGHSELLSETRRLTAEEINMGTDRAAELDRQLQSIREKIHAQPVVTLTYFVPDERKEGGAYITKTGAVVKYDAYNNRFVFADGTETRIAEIMEIHILGSEE